MVKWDVLADIDRSIKGERVINISAETQDQDLAQQIVANQINEEREKKGIILSEGEKESLSKIISNYLGKRDLAEQIIKIQPLFYDNNKIWWSWNKQRYKWEIIDETNILLFVRTLSRFNTIKSKEKVEVLEALKQEGRLNIPKPIKPTWIQFQDEIYNILTGEKFKATPEYFVTNPIPFKISGDCRTPTIDKIFKEWVGENYVQTLYEIIAYCLLPDYPLNRLFCFIGGGMNGKTCFLNLLKEFIGVDNITATELDVLLTSRFEVTRLHKKLVCIMGETNFSEMNKTSIIKKLTGQDVIGFEYKNKTPFEDVNYAKILIATNNLPTTTDKTIGFYRRWLIIDFPNHFEEKINILETIPKEEYNNLATNCVILLNQLLQKREFHNEGSVEERMKRFEERSDPLEKFLHEFTTDEDVNGYIFKWEFIKRLEEWLKENRFRYIGEVVVGKKMKEKGYENGRVSTNWQENGIQINKQVRAWLGIKWRE
jgi:P4 family phage/plasmid primase-like protien